MKHTQAKVIQLHLCITKSPSKFHEPFVQSSNSATKMSILFFFLLSYLFLSAITLMKACKNTKKSPQFFIFYEDVPFSTQALGYFTGYGSKLTLSQISTPFMMPFLFQMNQYHDDSPKVHNSNMMNIITQSKIPSF